MPRLAGASTLTIALVLGALGPAAPAEAGPYDVTVTSGPGVIFADCTDHPFNYSVTPPPAADQWSIQLDVRGPDGGYAGTLMVVSPAATAGVLTERFCPHYSDPGIYTVTGTYKVLEDDPDSFAYKQTITPVAPFTVEMRVAEAEVTAEPSDTTPRIGQLVTVRIKVADELADGGHTPSANAPVALQKRKGRKWVTVRGAKVDTSKKGSAVLKFRPKSAGRAKYRAHTKTHTSVKASSDGFTIRVTR